MKELIIGCDNAGYFLKVEIMKWLDKKGFTYTDLGVMSADDDTPYPEVAKRVTEAIKNSNYQKDGILICGTGIGMAIAANKFKGIYAAVCHDNFSAERARLSNDANVITMGARVIGPELAKKILAEWLSQKFVDSPSTQKIDLIKGYEKDNFK